MKVFMQYPWKISDSMYYKSLIENPPSGINYVNSQKKQGMIINSKQLLAYKFLKNCLRQLLEKTRFPLLNIRKTKYKNDYDLIHCAHCLSKNTNKFWVADFELCWQMWISGCDTKKGYEKALKILMSDNCKKVLAWTNDCKKEIISKFPQIKNKVDVVSYAMPAPIFEKIECEEICLLFVSRYFYEKGGSHVLDAIDRLTKKYKNIKCVFISRTPKKYIKKYSSNKKLVFYDLMSHQRLMTEVFPWADILIYPGYSDTFGFVFVEAQAFGIPIITVDGFARKDLVSEGKTGFIIKRRKNSNWYPSKGEEKGIIYDLVEKTSLLIEDEKLRKRMSRNCRRTVTKGKFSIKVRNDKLKEIYEETLK